MDIQEIYNELTKEKSAEEVLKNIIGTSIKQYNYLKIQDGEEMHPSMVIATIAMELEWGMAIPSADENGDIHGLIIGTEEYIDGLLGEDKPNNCCGDGECGGCGTTDDSDECCDKGCGCH